MRSGEMSNPFVAEAHLRVLMEAFCRNQGIDVSKAEARVLSMTSCEMAYPWPGSPTGERIVTVVYTRKEDLENDRIRVHGVIGGVPASVEAVVSG
jgi:hypothetical protein